jgi:hypothetical protein
MAPPAPAGYTRQELTALAAAVARRPGLWPTALAELRRLAPRTWWRTPPHLPLPDRRLWEFRMVTAYGNPEAVPDRDDVISFLEWCRATGHSGHRRADGQG